MNTTSESVISSGLLIRYPATTTRSTACAWMKVLDEIRTIVAVGGVVVVKTKSGLGDERAGPSVMKHVGKAASPIRATPTTDLTIANRTE